MAYRVAINGYGRIGQSVLRAIYERDLQHELQLVALNELSDIDTVTYLTRYDTTHGRFPLPVSNDGESLLIAEDRIRVLNQEDPRQLPWGELDLDLVLECSGSFSNRAMAEQHLAAGARRLLFSQPAQPDVDATIVCGVNQHSLKVSDRVVSAASCTTNCVIPILDLLDRHFGIEQGLTTTIHSAMNDQPVIDSYHRTDLRLTRSALQSIIPVDTGLDRGIDRLLPQLAGRFRCLHVRVPTINVSLMDMSLNLKRDTNAEEVNALLRSAAESGPLLGLLGYTEEPHASVDFNRDPRSGVVDGTQTRVAGERMLKLMCWFDNEWGFANRMLDVAQHWLNLR
ncbi:D-erythrose-4-phosphate dehydrogenase [Marinobacterium zhoushanense]|uniref:D-erythrose-4-phosphate dehydrogenase n=1 Tax=Marinobacterium zhoushanense TaxID=1679163 RepID=A0ABQ1KGI7_9GAMM|nr:glyceraldehyde 3-phosphate dehydrogenase NAD-binding domain-containing protein [Marinobacterium zhoushanense]GGB97673.1 D-erythrose-4-phosphate dehydrogenase [Marinobacterium zhoushanense]